MGEWIDNGLGGAHLFGSVIVVFNKNRIFILGSTSLNLDNFL